MNWRHILLSISFFSFTFSSTHPIYELLAYAKQVWSFSNSSASYNKPGEKVEERTNTDQNDNESDSNPETTEAHSYSSNNSNLQSHHSSLHYQRLAFFMHIIWNTKGFGVGAFTTYKLLQHYYKTQLQSLKIVEIDNESAFDVRITVPLSNHAFWSLFKKPGSPSSFDYIIIPSKKAWRQEKIDVHPLNKITHLFKKSMSELLVYEDGSACNITISTNMGWFQPFVDVKEGLVGISGPTISSIKKGKGADSKIILLGEIDCFYSHQVKLIITQEGLVDIVLR